MRTLYYKVEVALHSGNVKLVKEYTVIQSNTPNEQENRERAKKNAIRYMRNDKDVFVEQGDWFEAEILEIAEV